MHVETLNSLDIQNLCLRRWLYKWMEVMYKLQAICNLQLKGLT